MIAYLSLAVAAVSSIVAVFIAPHSRKRDGTEKLNRWVVIFVALPIAAFIVGAINIHARNKESAHLNAMLGDLRSKIKRSLAHIETYKVTFTYAFKASDVGIENKLVKSLKKFPVDIAVATTDKDGNFRNGVDRAYLRRLGGPLFGAPLVVYRTVEDALATNYEVQDPELFLIKKTGNGMRAIEILKKAIRYYLNGFDINTSKIGKPFYKQLLINPIIKSPDLPSEIKTASYDWTIYDISEADPIITLRWSYNFYTVAGSGFEYADDFRRSAVAMVVPRFNPDTDPAPSEAAYTGVFGKLIGTQVDAGGSHYLWSAKQSSSNNTIRVAVKMPGEKKADLIGWIVDLGTKPTNR